VKSAYLIGATSEDLERVSAVWRARPDAETADDVIQWYDSGYLFNVFTEFDNLQESDWREGWRESESADSEPPPEARSWYIECRSEEVVARLLREAAALAPGRLWVLDGNDVVWPAEAIDPARIVL
jgi:hypothetical protein